MQYSDHAPTSQGIAECIESPLLLLFYAVFSLLLLKTPHLAWVHFPSNLFFNTFCFSVVVVSFKFLFFFFSYFSPWLQAIIDPMFISAAS